MRELKKHFGKRLREIRKRNGLTQEKLAEYLDVSTRQITRIETGENFPSVETLAKLDVILDVDIMCLFDFNNRVKLEKTGTDDEDYIMLTKTDNMYEIDRSTLPKKAMTKYPKRITASRSDTSMVLMAKNNKKPIAVTYPMTEKGVVVKIYYPDGKIEVRNEMEEKRKEKLREEIKKAIAGKNIGEAELKYIKTAIDSITSINATIKLKEIIKGIEAIRGM